MLQQRFRGDCVATAETTSQQRGVGPEVGGYSGPVHVQHHCVRSNDISILRKPFDHRSVCDDVRNQPLFLHLCKKGACAFVLPTSNTSVNQICVCIFIWSQLHSNKIVEALQRISQHFRIAKVRDQFVVMLHVFELLRLI